MSSKHYKLLSLIFMLLQWLPKAFGSKAISMPPPLCSCYQLYPKPVHCPPNILETHEASI